MGSAQPRACTHGPDGAPSPSSSPSAQGLLQTRAGGSEHTGPSASPCSEGRPRRHQHRRIGDICRAHHTQQTPSRGLQRLVRAGPQCASGACAACPQLARGHSAGELGWGVTLSPPPSLPPPQWRTRSPRASPALWNSKRRLSPAPRPRQTGPEHAAPAPCEPWPGTRLGLATGPHAHTLGPPRTPSAHRLFRAGVPFAGLCSLPEGTKPWREGPGLVPESPQPRQGTGGVELTG